MPEDIIMDSRHISMVKESFEKLSPYSNRIARVFYAQLFELKPELRPLFKKDMRDQRRKFIKSLTYIVANLHDANNIQAYIKQLVKEDINLNIKKEYYKTFKDALIFSLSAALGDDFTPAIKASWEASYSTLIKLMINESKL